MKSITNTVLSVNCGSSSIKFTLYNIDGPLTQLVTGEIASIGASASFSFVNTITNQKDSININADSDNAAGAFLISWLEKQDLFISLKAVGHRIVHGMEHTAPELIAPGLLEELNKIAVFDPEHLPDEIKLIRLFMNHYPALVQIACFDTSFHTSMPAVARRLAIPRRYQARGIRRYGFHGISYAFLMDELRRLTDNETANAKIILAHLGKGASLAAVEGGESIDTRMGFTPSSGLPMGTRTGDIDPGIATYILRSEKLDSDRLSDLVNFESVLLGVSETSSDMRKLLAIRNSDSRADEAVELFCCKAQKWIGSYFVVLGGLDTIVFSGGIGAHSPEIRNEICDGLACIWVELDEIKNMNNEAIISSAASRVNVHVIETNEELMIAQMVCQIMKYVVQ